MMQEAPPGQASLADLAWLVGSWQGQAFNGQVDEHWAAPAGGTMMGMFRLVRAGATPMMEFMVISDEPHGLVFRFKHFTPEYTTWEDEPLTYHLTELRPQRATFEMAGRVANKPRRIIYTRPTADSVIVLGEGWEVVAGGDPDSFAVPMRRVGTA